MGIEKLLSALFVLYRPVRGLDVGNEGGENRREREPRNQI